MDFELTSALWPLNLSNTGKAVCPYKTCFSPCQGSCFIAALDSCVQRPFLLCAKPLFLPHTEGCFLLCAKLLFLPPEGCFLLCAKTALSSTEGCFLLCAKLPEAYPSRKAAVEAVLDGFPVHLPADETSFCIRSPYFGSQTFLSCGYLRSIIFTCSFEPEAMKRVFHFLLDQGGRPVRRYKTCSDPRDTDHPLQRMISFHALVNAMNFSLKMAACGCRRRN